MTSTTITTTIMTTIMTMTMTIITMRGTGTTVTIGSTVWAHVGDQPPSVLYGFAGPTNQLHRSVGFGRRSFYFALSNSGSFAMLLGIRLASSSVSTQAMLAASFVSRQ